MIIRRLARPLLAAIFIWGGLDTLRNPDARVRVATPMLTKVVEKAGSSLPEQLPTDPATLVKIDAAVKLGAGVGLALGRFPRLSAFLLAGSLVPTTLAAHSFWEHEEPVNRAAQRTHFLKNLGLCGGLLFASLDDGGKAVRKAKKTAKAAKREAKKAAKAN
jgi:putative oxidoreductase